MKTEYDQISAALEEVCEKVRLMQMSDKSKQIILAEIHGIQWWTLKNMARGKD
jgi:hypothetical protein